MRLRTEDSVMTHDEIKQSIINAKRIVVKIGTTTITHEETGSLNLIKLEKLIRILTDMRNSGKEVVLVSSGAIGVGRKALALTNKPEKKSLKQACAAVGQARLMMVYQKLFGEYNQTTAQILMTKITMMNDENRCNALNTFNELLSLGIIPIVNENDTVVTDEIEFGDNDSLSAIVASLIGADLLILLSDIDGLYTDDPHKDANAKLIRYVKEIDDNILSMAKGSNSSLGTGGMATKITAAEIATYSGADMIIANGDDIINLARIMYGEQIGTFFGANKKEDFNLMDYIGGK